MNMSILKVVVFIVGGVMLLCSAGVILLIALDKDVPSQLWTIILSGFTGLLGLLAPSKEVAVPPAQGGA